MNFIIDGMDRCGKTTLVNKLSKIMDRSLPIISMHYPKIHFSDGEDKVKYCKRLYSTTFAQLQYLTQINGQFIMDRSHISEYVYGQLYRKYDSRYAMESENCMEFSALIRITTLIILVDDAENIHARDDGQSNSVDHNDLTAERHLFKYAFQDSTIQKKIFINISDKTEDDVFNLIRDHQLRQFNKNGDYYGN